MPNTAHPELAQHAEFVRSLMAAGEHHIVLAQPWTTLTVQRAWAPAPHVGDPFVYVWLVAVDETNRWVSGEAHGEFIS